jgi:predicted metal-dependent phosphoesterase TrpH
MIDLHTHTNASDGSYSLEELLRMAERAGLSAMAVTDHDTVENARKLSGMRSPVELIAGIEISVYDNNLGYIDLHVLGLFIDPENKSLLSTLERLERDRDEQKRSIIEELGRMGYDISYEEAKAKAAGSFGRPHIAKVLMEKYPEEFPAMASVFEKLLDQGKPAFRARKSFFCLDEAINLIHSAGGLAILAHPKVYRYDLEKLLADFKRLGGDGIETFYDYHSNGYNKLANRLIGEEMRILAKKFAFLESGGSDFHSEAKGAPLGYNVPDAVLSEMKAARVNNFKSNP